MGCTASAMRARKKGGGSRREILQPLSFPDTFHSHSIVLSHLLFVRSPLVSFCYHQLRTWNRLRYDEFTWFRTNFADPREVGIRCLHWECVFNQLVLNYKLTFEGSDGGTMAIYAAKQGFRRRDIVFLWLGNNFSIFVSVFLTNFNPCQCRILHVWTGQD